jgi:hypothetical protein
VEAAWLLTKLSILAATTVALALSTTAISAHADRTPAEAELATARALFEEGLAREDAKDWRGALARFRRVAEIRVTPQVLYNIALCLDRIGKLASADQAYARVEKAGDESNEPSVRELARLATARRKELRATIPEVTLDASAVPAGAELVVTIDGAAVPASSMHAPFAIDPGAHELVARRDGAEARRSFTTQPGSHAVVVVPVPVAVDATPPATAEDTGGHVPAGAWITGGVGVVAIGAGVFALLSRSSAESELDAVCGPNRDACPESKRSVADRAVTMTTVANVSFVVAGVAAVSTAAIVYFAWKPAGRSTALVIAPQAGGVTLGGLF